MATPAGEFKCSKCDRSFSMVAHLGRHMSTIHASPKAKAAREAKVARKTRAGKKASAGKKATVGTRAGAGKKRRGAKVRAKAGAKLRRGAARRAPTGRASRAVSRLGLRNMTMDQLAEVIEAARGELDSKIKHYRREFA